MSFKDIFKKSFLEGYAGSEITLTTIVAAIALTTTAALLGYPYYEVKIKKIELDEGGYEHTENKDDFKNFNELVEEEKFKQKLMGYFDQIEINEEIIAKYPINEVIYSESWTYMF